MAGGEERFPAMVAPKGFLTHLPDLASDLPGPLEARLILSAGRFHRPAAQRFAFRLGRPIGRMNSFGRSRETFTPDFGDGTGVSIVPS